MAKRIGLLVIILAVSLGSGHLVQTRAAQENAERTMTNVSADNG
jgi:hypothetical protein